MRSINTRKQYWNLIVSIIAFFLLVACQSTPKWAPYFEIANEVYPNEKWQKVETPEQLGWSSEKLADAREYSKN